MFTRKIAAIFDQSRENMSQHETIEKHEKVLLKAYKVGEIFSLEINTFYKISRDMVRCVTDYIISSVVKWLGSTRGQV